MVVQLTSKSGFLKNYDPAFRAAAHFFWASGKGYMACLPFMPRALHSFLKQDGRVAFVLTSSLLKLLNAGGFRERLIGYKIDKILDLTLYTTIHEGASCWSFVPVVTNTMADASQKVEYEYYIPSVKPSKIEGRQSFKVEKWQIEAKRLFLEPTDAKSPWFTGKREAEELLRKIQRFPRLGDVYKINQGINTRGANPVYFLKNYILAEGNYAVAETFGKKKIRIERNLIFPLVQGKNLRAWTFETAFAIVPHNASTWAPISLSTMEDKFSEALAYFE